MTAALYGRPHFRLAGDQGLLVEYGDAIDPAVNQKVRAMFMALSRHPPEGVVEAVPTYRSLLILYDPAATAPAQLQEALLELEERFSEIRIPPPEIVEIPVCYGGDFGPDMGNVARLHHIRVEEVIRYHAEPLYPVYMMGFTPGFPFLGGLPEILHTPRLKTPRTLVPAGTVAIANDQTGIYSVDSPGGWQLIGRTPLKLFDPGRPKPFLLQTGDSVKFHPIGPAQYDRLAGSL